jgi:hypothetical protein
MILIVSKKMTQQELKQVCEAHFGTWVKFVADIKKAVLAVGGELHADGEAQLIESGSGQSDLWGGNFYPWKVPEERMEFTSFINIRPLDNNAGMEVMEPKIREKIKNLAERILMADNESMSITEPE